MKDNSNDDRILIPLLKTVELTLESEELLKESTIIPIATELVDLTFKETQKAKSVMRVTTNSFYCILTYK